MIGKTTTFDNYFADTVAAVGLKGEQAEIALKTQSQIIKDLKDLRESLSGVNIDEELSNMIKFQHAMPRWPGSFRSTRRCWIPSSTA